MEDMELLIRAKTYIDKLANGINPINDEYVDESDVVNNVRISRCLFYTSGILKQITRYYFYFINNLYAIILKQK